MTQTYERPRLLVLDILESYARERETHVVLERVSAQQRWVCTLSSDEAAARSICTTARAAIMGALKQAGVSVPQW
jgi:hypothetical protein